MFLALHLVASIQVASIQSPQKQNKTKNIILGSSANCVEEGKGRVPRGTRGARGPPGGCWDAAPPGVDRGRISPAKHCPFADGASWRCPFPLTLRPYFKTHIFVVLNPSGRRMVGWDSKSFAIASRPGVKRPG